MSNQISRSDGPQDVQGASMKADIILHIEYTGGTNVTDPTNFLSNICMDVEQVLEDAGLFKTSFPTKLLSIEFKPL